MTTAYVPYSRTAPKTIHLPTLKAELERVRAEYGVASSQGLEAYLRYSHAAASQGRPLDALRTYVEDEEERFFAQTIAGTDGHTYWDGARGGFRRNDGATRLPIRWWWEHRHGEIGQGDQVVATCGERNCITVDHAELLRRADRHRIHTDAQMLGALQVWALRHERTPTKVEWNREHPAGMTASAIMMRFGTWNAALRGAGLSVREAHVKVPPADCVRAIQVARAILNRWPSTHDMRHPSVKDRLRAEGLPSFATIFVRLGGSWAEALRRAGRRG